MQQNSERSMTSALRSHRKATNPVNSLEDLLRGKLLPCLSQANVLCSDMPLCGT